MWLEKISSPADLADLDFESLDVLCQEIRTRIIETVTVTGGHLGSNLGAVELTVALHRAFESPKDIIIFDTGHQAYVHKLLTGRQDRFETIRSENGMSGYPNRSESPHDWVENSHASTALSYAYGISASLALGLEPEVGSGEGKSTRRVIAVVGDGALTGGMAYEALNNIGHARSKTIVVWNDNGRSYAPTVSRLSEGLTKLRLHPSYMHARNKISRVISDLPGVGPLATSGIAGLTTALREAIEPKVFFEALGVRYTGPIDGHNIAEMEYAFKGAAEWDGPIVVHVLTQKGRGYGPAETDEVQRLHDLKIPVAVSDSSKKRYSYTEAFSTKLLELAAERPEIVAITAAMPSPTGLLALQKSFPERFFDVGIAEQHAVTAAAGMAMGGLKPVVAIYSTFMSRAFDQVNLDVALHGLPVVFVMDRAGITGDDGPSHHGVMDLIQFMSIPKMTVFAPSGIEELQEMLKEALEIEGPTAIRFPKTLGPLRLGEKVGSGLKANKLRSGNSGISLVGVGKMAEAVWEASRQLEEDGVEVSVWDPRVLAPLDTDMLDELASSRLVVVVEDGFVPGGAGSHISDALSKLSYSQSFMSLGVPLGYIAQAKPDSILAELGLDAGGIAKSVLARAAAASVFANPESNQNS